DEKGVRGLHTECVQGREVDLGIGFDQPAVGREGLRVEEPCELGLRPGRRHLLRADRDQAELHAALTQARKRLARTPTESQGTAGKCVPRCDVLGDVLVGYAQRAVGVRKRAGLRRSVAVAPATLELVWVNRRKRCEALLQNFRLTGRKLDERVPEIENDG